MNYTYQRYLSGRLGKTCKREVCETSRRRRLYSLEEGKCWQTWLCHQDTDHPTLSDHRKSTDGWLVWQKFSVCWFGCLAIGDSSCALYCWHRCTIYCNLTVSVLTSGRSTNLPSRKPSDLCHWNLQYIWQSVPKIEAVDVGWGTDANL